MAEVTHAHDVIELYLAQDSYLELLGEEINDLIGIAYIHGWRSTRHELGVKMRERIEEAKKKVSYLPIEIKHAAGI